MPVDPQLLVNRCDNVAAARRLSLRTLPKQRLDVIGAFLLSHLLPFQRLRAAPEGAARLGVLLTRSWA